MLPALLLPLTALLLTQSGVVTEIDESGVYDWDTLLARYRCGKKEELATCAARLHAALKKELARPKPTIPMAGLAAPTLPKSAPAACPTTGACHWRC